jgi:hypothetical protein
MKKVCCPQTARDVAGCPQAKAPAKRTCVLAAMLAAVITERRLVIWTPTV